tara:strand:+ start:264 stop:1043 length:780 start_codon:yes stop_codon:yes gene_type:complete
MTDYDLMNTGILGVGMDPYNYPDQQMITPDWDERDDYETQIAALQPSLADQDEKGNLFQQGLDYAMNMNPVRGLTSAYNFAKGNVMMPALGVMGMIANQRNPLNPNSANYNPELQGQIDMLRSSGILGGGDPSGPYRITSGPLAGKNLVSGWGTNDYNAMLQKRIDYFRKRKTRTTLQNQKMHEAIAEQERIEKQRQEEAANAAAAAQVRANIQRYGSGDRPSTGMNVAGGEKGQSPTGGDVAGTPFAYGGLASLWQRY